MWCLYLMLIARSQRSWVSSLLRSALRAPPLSYAHSQCFAVRRGACCCPAVVWVWASAYWSLPLTPVPSLRFGGANDAAGGILNAHSRVAKGSPIFGLVSSKILPVLISASRFLLDSSVASSTFNKAQYPSAARWN